MAEEVARIVIVDPDEKYIRSYEEELLKKYAQKAVVQIITNYEYRENYFRLNRDIDLLIIDQMFYGDFLKEQNIAHTIVLQTEVTTDIEETDTQKILMKYLPVEKLFEVSATGFINQEGSNTAGYELVVQEVGPVLDIAFEPAGEDEGAPSAAVLTYSADYAGYALEVSDDSGATWHAPALAFPTEITVHDPEASPTRFYRLVLPASAD